MRIYTAAPDKGVWSLWTKATEPTTVPLSVSFITVLLSIVCGKLPSWEWLGSHLSLASLLLGVSLSKGSIVANRSHHDIQQQQLNRHTQSHSSYFKIRCSVKSPSYVNKTIACLLSLLSVFLSTMSVWGFFFQMLRYHETVKHRTGQTDAAGVVRPLWNAPALNRSSWELYCVGRLAAASSISPKMQGLAASHNNEHLCRATLLSLHITVNDRRGYVLRIPFNELQVCACHKTRN